MNILITGSNGFVGKNLIERLNKIGGFNIITYGRQDSFDKIEKNINNIDFIIHLAGVCRSNNKEDFININLKLTEDIINLVNKVNKDIPMIFSSSIHAGLDTDYGQTKLAAENIIKENINNSYIFRFHNLFGKYAKVNHHSVVANFCYNISHDLEIVINDPNVIIEFAYIDDVIDEIIKVINLKKNKNEILYINPRYNISIGNLAETIMKFKNGQVPINEFEQKLYITYNYYKNEK